MAVRTYNWSEIAQHPRYLELKSQKRKFLFSWWLGSSVYYFLLTILSGYFPDLFKIKLMGVINFGYLFILSQFVMAFFVAIHYTKVANNKFDPMTEELLETLQREG